MGLPTAGMQTLMTFKQLYKLGGCVISFETPFKEVLTLKTLPLRHESYEAALWWMS